MNKKSKKDPYRPNVEIRSRESQSVSVSFTFPDGKGGTIDFFYAAFPDGTEGEPRIYVYSDGGVRIYTPCDPGTLSPEPKT
jgi:hypothetical protein